MTIFRSRWFDWPARVVAVIGLFGFFACAAVNFGAQSRVLENAKFEQPTAQRSIAIELKGKKVFVEPSYAQRLEVADDLSLWFWLIAAIGFLYWHREKIASRLKARNE